MSVRTIRGAITTENTREDILADAEALLRAIIERNTLSQEDIASILFTCTRDLTAVYPAVAARALGLTEAGLMCAQELYVEGSMEKCVRVLVTVESDLKQGEMKHIYMKEAMQLRPDLADRGAK